MSHKAWQNAHAMYENDACAKALGIDIISMDEGFAVVTMTVTAQMLNGHQSCHGGQLFSLADTAFAYACNSQGLAAVASACTIDFLRPGFAGDTLTATAQVRHQGKQTGVYDIEIVNQQQKTVEVTLRQLDKLNSLLDGALKAGLNEIRSVSLGVAQPDAYKDKARKAAIDNAIHQAQELANGFHRKLGPVYSVRYHVSNYQPSPMVRMMKADAAPVSAQETYEQAAIQFDDQVDVVFQLEPVDQQPAKTPAAQ